MNNIPEVKLGIIAVSRDCFPIDLAQRRRAAVVKELKKKGVKVAEIKTIIEGGIDQNVLEAYEEIKKSKCNALVVFLGNFGPEGPETAIAKLFGGPVMYAAISATFRRSSSIRWRTSSTSSSFSLTSSAMSFSPGPS